MRRHAHCFHPNFILHCSVTFHESITRIIITGIFFSYTAKAREKRDNVNEIREQ